MGGGDKVRERSVPAEFFTARLGLPLSSVSLPFVTSLALFLGTSKPIPVVSYKPLFTYTLIWLESAHFTGCREIACHLDLGSAILQGTLVSFVESGS